MNFNQHRGGGTNMTRALTVTAMMKLLPLLLLLLVAFDARGQETAEERLEKFNLYTGCSDVDLIVEDIDENDAGLTREQVITTVRSRLRGARIYYGADANVVPNYLYVNVNVAGRGYSYNIELMKILLDERTGYRFPATTWRTGSTGQSGNAGFILQNLGNAMDRFIDEYLRVNEEACE